MTIIANKPFTQLLNLNVIDELRVDGIIVTAVERQIVEISVNYNQDVDDDFIIATGVVSVFLLALTAARKELTLKALTGSTITVVPDGSDTIETGGGSVTSNTAVTLVPTSSGWVIT